MIICTSGQGSLQYDHGRLIMYIAIKAFFYSLKQWSFTLVLAEPSMTIQLTHRHFDANILMRICILKDLHIQNIVDKVLFGSSKTCTLHIDVLEYWYNSC